MSVLFGGAIKYQNIMQTSNFLSKFTKYEYLNFGWIKIPRVPITPEIRQQFGAPPDASNFEFLKHLTREGFKRKVPKSEWKEKSERILYELETINSLGFTDYILLVWKMCYWADQNHIPRGRGRGSVCGSATCFCLDLSKDNPWTYNLLFERFISAARAKSKVVDGQLYVDGKSIADIDNDFSFELRKNIVTYLQLEYPNRVAKIGAISSLQGRQLIKLCGKTIAEKQEEEMKQISDLVPKIHGVVCSIKEAYEGKKGENGEWESQPVEKFRAFVKEYPKLYSISNKLQGLQKNTTSHPSGFIVAHDELDEFIPLQLARKSKSNANGEEELTDELEVVSCFTQDSVAALAVKVDILGLRCVSVIADIVKQTGVNLDDINLHDDPRIYSYFQKDMLVRRGCFQIEADTNFRVCQVVKPINMLELSDCLAISRPGGLSCLSGYVERKETTKHPLIDEILKPTRGYNLYQEGTMRLLHAIGFTLVQADECRRIIGKKLRDEVGAWKEKIYNKISENDLPKELGDMLWNSIYDSASYQFNLSHSVSYASLAATCIFLREVYPQQFYKSLLQNALFEPDTLQEVFLIQQELKHFGLTLYPPSLANSGLDFALEGDKGIRMGLSAIKGVSSKKESKVLELKKFLSPNVNKFELFQAVKTAKIDIGLFSGLIYAGTIDDCSSNTSRPRLVLEAQTWWILSEKERKLCFDRGAENKYCLLTVVQWLRENNDSKGKPFIKPSRWETIIKAFEPYKAVYLNNKKYKRLCSFIFERAYIGYSYSFNLFDIFKDQPGVRDLRSIQECIDEEDGLLEFVGVVIEERVWNSKKGNKCMKLKITDGESVMESIITNNQKENRIEAIKTFNQGKLPEEDDIIHCTAQKSKGSIFIDKIAIQNIKVFMKFAQYKKHIKDEEKELESKF